MGGLHRIQSRLARWLCVCMCMHTWEMEFLCHDYYKVGITVLDAVPSPLASSSDVPTFIEKEMSCFQCRVTYLCPDKLVWHLARTVPWVHNLPTSSVVHKRRLWKAVGALLWASPPKPHSSASTSAGEQWIHAVIYFSGFCFCSLGKFKIYNILSPIPSLELAIMQLVVLYVNVRYYSIDKATSDTC